MAFYSVIELEEIGFKRIGKNVKISKDARIYSPNKIEIGNDVRIDDFCILSGNITIGNNIHLAPYCHLAAGSSKITMEDFSGLAFNVIVTASSDDYSGRSMTNPTVPDIYKPFKKTGEITIKKHAIIGASSIVMPKVVIETGSAVGALSFVNKSTEKWSIYHGNPAKKIMNRKKEILKLEEKFNKGVES